jgi:secreted trypsin-like serine protease
VPFHLRLAAVILLLLFFSSCTNQSSSKAPVGPVSPEGCFPETELNQPGIVGGDRVYQTDADAKRVVLLFVDGAICTASPIAEDVLITAAHCVMGSAKKSFVAFYSSISCESGFNVKNSSQTSGVREFIYNESYDDRVSPSAMVGDIALVFLNKKIPDGYPIYKIANPFDVDQHKPIQFFGYGNIGLKKGGRGILRKTSVSGANFEIDRVERKVKIDQSGGHGICSGDSGGPGLVEIDNELEILGINSYVTPDGNVDACRGKASLVLADSYRDWIEKKLASRGRHLKQ